MSKVETYDCKVHGYDHFGEVVDYETYLAAVKSLMCTQRLYGYITLKGDDIMTDRMKLLIKEVKTRKNAVTKALFKEQITEEYQPFKMIGEVPKIEEWLWNNANCTASFGASSLRNRFQFLATLCGVLRSESLFKADLSDLCDIIIDSEVSKEPSPYHIVVLQIGEGKQNADKNIFGRFMRHRDPRLCALGALAMYLFLRFQVTEEHKQFNFFENNSWFNAKSLCQMPKRKKKHRSDQRIGES